MKFSPVPAKTIKTKFEKKKQLTESLNNSEQRQNAIFRNYDWLTFDTSHGYTVVYIFIMFAITKTKN